MKSTMKHQFSEVPRMNIPRSSFNRSHGVKTTFNGGHLVPIFNDVALPGDTFNLKTAGFIRMTPPVHPVMDNVIIETFYFAVPYRLVWNNFQKFQGEQEDPGDSTDYLIPEVDVTTGYPVGSLGDYFGLPVNKPIKHNSLMMRAYLLIWNEWFRDENLQNSANVLRDDGPDPELLYVSTLPRGKRHDYLTSCLVAPQKGPDVNIPLGNNAAVTGIGKTDQIYSSSTVNVWETGKTALREYAYASDLGGDAEGWFAQGTDPLTGKPNIRVDLTTATGATVNALRESVTMQHIFEQDARAGTRYTEITKSLFGVTSPDARLQRPEFLGGGKLDLNIQPQYSTADTVDPTAETGRTLGSLGAVGTAGFNGHGFVKSFTEHTLIIGMINVRADLTYQNCVNREWSKRTRFDMYMPPFANLGEQAVLNKEIYFKGDTTDDDVFGYQEYAAEYRYKPSQITGQFRSDSTDLGGNPNSLDNWHLAQEFTDTPALNSDFIQDDPPFDRVLTFPAATAMHFIADFYHDLKCARPMPLFGVPGLRRL